jgi:hypothetical protein
MTKENEIYRDQVYFHIGYRLQEGVYRRERGLVSYCCENMKEALAGEFIRLGNRFKDPVANDTVNISHVKSIEGFQTIDTKPISFCPFCKASILVETSPLPGEEE